MATGRQIIETAIEMSMADLSVLVSATRGPAHDAVLITTQDSANDRLWSLMAERGWLKDLGDPHPDIPVPMTSFSLLEEHRPNVQAVAQICFEGLRQGMEPAEIMAFAEGKSDPRLNHFL